MHGRIRRGPTGYQLQATDGFLSGYDLWSSDGGLVYSMRPERFVLFERRRLIAGVDYRYWRLWGRGSIQFAPGILIDCVRWVRLDG